MAVAYRGDGCCQVFDNGQRVECLRRHSTVSVLRGGTVSAVSISLLSICVNWFAAAK